MDSDNWPIDRRNDVKSFSPKDNRLMSLPNEMQISRLELVNWTNSRLVRLLRAIVPLSY